MYQVIFVDDEEITRMAVNNFITKTFSEIELIGTFSNGADAYDFITNNSVDIVITDIRMPQMDGLALVKILSESFPHIITFIISGYSEFEYAKEALKYGVSNYLLKPLDFEELSANLNAAVAKLNSRIPPVESLDFTTEDIELFFIDLLMGSLNDMNHLKKRFAPLKLPFSLDHDKGFLLKFSLERNEALLNWKYGKEKLGTALTNALRMFFLEGSVYEVIKTGTYYYYLFITKAPSSKCDHLELVNYIYQILNFRCNIILELPFQSLVELSTSNIYALDLADKKEAETPNDDIVIQKAIEFIEKNYGMDLSREDVADAVYLSSAYFSRFFKQKTGMNFYDYLTTVRMKKAKELLGTKMKINDIAKQVGYQSRNRFFINFRQYTSYNPTEYRRQILKTGDQPDAANT